LDSFGNKLIFITGDERDIIRLPTNYRKDEQVFMYRTTVSAERARKYSPSMPITGTS